MSEVETCPGCGVARAPVETTGHAYIGASPSCWALYGEVLAREYADPACSRAHRMTVDAYCAQHPGRPEWRAIQSVNVHLAGLYLSVVRRLPGDQARGVIGTLVTEHASDFTWLEPPSAPGEVRVDHVAAARDADEHARRVGKWAESVWSAWSDHHDHVARLVARARG